MFLFLEYVMPPGYMTKSAQTSPTKNPVTTCESECCRRIMRADPTIPARSITKDSHHIGLNEKAIE